MQKFREIDSQLKYLAFVSGVLLSNFDQEYTNTFYHSIYDNATQYDYNYDDGENSDLVNHLATIAETVAETAFSISGKKSNNLTPEFKANKTLINELIYCYTVSSDCPMFRAVNDISAPMTLLSYPYPQYVGVSRSLTFHAEFSSRLLAFVTSKPIKDLTPSNCTTPKGQNVYQYIKIKGFVKPDWYEHNQTVCDYDSECGYCLNTTMWRSDATSPGKSEMILIL